MNAKEMRDLEDRELSQRITTLRKDLFGLRFANATGELDDTAGIARAKRDLARALTVAHERELAAPQSAMSRQLPTSEMRTDG
jgi:large subunit ribosomal protein L29